MAYNPQTRQAPDAERALLGCAMLDGETIPPLLDELTPDDFAAPEHGALWALIRSQYRAHGADGCGLVELPMAVAMSGTPDRFGGVEYVTRLGDAAPSTAAAPAYRRTVLEAAQRRRLDRIAERITAAIDEGKSAEEVIAGVTLALGRMAAQQRREARSLSDAVSGALERLEQARETRGGDRLTTGLRSLDHAIGGGMRRGKLVLIGARPRVGKTSLAMQIAAANAAAGGSVLILSAEMETDELGERVLADKSGVDAMWLGRPHQLDTRQWEALMRAEAEVREAGLCYMIDDQSSPSLAYIEGAARRHIARFGSLDLLVIDYFQILDFGGDTRNPLQAKEAMSTGLMKLGKDLGCTVVVLAQLNREVDRRAENIPQLSDLKGCGKLEEDGYLVLLPHRPAVFDESQSERKASIHVVKHRGGPMGVVEMEWDGPSTRFVDAASSVEEAFFGDGRAAK